MVISPALLDPMPSLICRQMMPALRETAYVLRTGPCPGRSLGASEQHVVTVRAAMGFVGRGGMLFVADVRETWLARSPVEIKMRIQVDSGARIGAAFM